MDDKTIITLTPEALFSREVFDEIYDNEDELERARLIGLCKMRAKEFHAEKELSEIFRAYNAADEALAAQYKKEAARRDGRIVLEYGGDGKPLKVTENFIRIMKNDDCFKTLKFNLLTHSPEHEVAGETERWTDTDDAKTRHYIEKKYHLHNAQKCDDALRIIFSEREYHPIRDIVDKLKWDGKSRIYNFLHYAAKCEDNEYTREVSRLIFAGGIHRLYNNGCKFDDMPVLIGTKQGEGKSTLVRWLALKDDFFTEVTEIEGQKGMEAVEGAWICEMGELLALTKAREVEAVKSYLTRQVDRYRMPFDKRVTDHKRQCIFIGTTNKEQFLTDKTGNRRFYPVKVYQSGYELYSHETEIKEYIRQCWAEAKQLYDKGELKPFADRQLIDVIRNNQSRAVEDDYREGLIEEYLKDKEEVCVLQIWKYAFDNERSKPSKKDSNEIALILNKVEGWEKQKRMKRFGEFGPQMYWMKIRNDDLSKLPF